MSELGPEPNSRPHHAHRDRRGPGRAQGQTFHPGDPRRLTDEGEYRRPLPRHGDESGGVN